MKKSLKRFLVVSLAVSFFGAAGYVGATLEAVPTLTSTQLPVTEIELKSEGDKVRWEVDGYSAKGFKVVWSKTEGPTYPLRPVGDKYFYSSDSNLRETTITPFMGDGTYYVRVCEYLGGACGLYSNEVKVVLGTETPVVCTMEYAPVCGDLGSVKKTYGNKCMMEGAGAKYLYSGECGETKSVERIELQIAATNKVKWEAEGKSVRGFKVVWSMNPTPTYPTRVGDKYNYHSDPSSYYSVLKAFSGTGVYYVRVCEYLGGACGVYSNEIKVELSADAPIACTREYVPVCGKVEIQCITTPCDPIAKTFSNKCELYAAAAEYLYHGECGEKITEYSKDEDIKSFEEKSQFLFNNQLDNILSELKQLRDMVREQQNQITYLKGLVADMGNIAQAMQDSINQFITYGVDDNTQRLGAGERAAVIYSFKSAFKKLPENESEMADAIKIASGRWPSRTSEEAEANAKAKFFEIYVREANMDNSNDNAAVTVMAYGLRQKAENRNLDSERNGINIFKGIFKKLPVSTEDWNAMQAITYSGATR